MLCLEDNIVSFVPSRLGYSDGKLALLDCGTDALISLMKSPRTAAGVVIPSRAATKGYIQALAMLRSCVSLGNVGMDECIGAIGLLGMFDTLVRDRLRATVDCFKHWRGVSAIICQDPLKSSNNVFAQAPAAPFGGGILSFIIPCFQGRASPFDGAAGWSEMPPLSAMGSREAVRLNRVSYRLFVRLPRLVCLVRQWKDGELSDLDNEDEMKQLANELTASEDRDAEFRLLDRTLACPTQDPATSRITPESIRMTSAREAATALCYWQTRIIALKLMDTVEMGSTPYRHTEETRIAMNILKACEYTESCGYCATASVAIALVTVWLVFGLNSDGQGKFTDDLAESILRTLGRCWSGAAIGGTREQLDKAANVLVGGKLEGYFIARVKD
ncbi:hypothetical protein PRZ48_013320 [Zasmidium cellare]|uniref:Uncharacterized protein n=1 Tax=Zasmidium cellare TaxID=395010 RepID=A0ABR0E3Q0_ZASCE|nr:hypothetical protein PRZ48_013320 [Zasmidium cellare]